MKKLVLGGIVLALCTLLSIVVILGMFNNEVSAEINSLDTLGNYDEKEILLIHREIEAGRYIDMCDVDESIYNRPEFYPKWESAYSRHYANHNFQRWNINGYGTFPSGKVSLGNFKKGEQFKVCTFLKTGWAVETYQGVMLTAINNGFFETKIDPSIFMLYPSFPKFKKGWVRKVEVTFTAKENIPIGTYNLGFNVIPPPADLENIFRERVSQMEIEDRQDYLEICNNQMEDKDIKNECEKWYILRQNMYINGGNFDTGTNTFSYTIEVVSD